MRTVITTREYDDAGKLTRETEIVYDSRLNAAPPWSGQIIDTTQCLCGRATNRLCPVHTYTVNAVRPACTCPKVWMSVSPPPPCPVHGQMQTTTVTC